MPSNIFLSVSERLELSRTLKAAGTTFLPFLESVGVPFVRAAGRGVPSCQPADINVCLHSSALVIRISPHTIIIGCLGGNVKGKRWEKC